jgi:surface polysaccharide O-acyltransferase-like enzyme
MLMVMICHAIGYVQESDLVGASGVAKVIINQFCIVDVNVFVMISGWFGIRASVKGAVKLLFQVWFLAILCFLVFLCLGLPLSFKQDLLPYLLFGSGYWFVVAYLILYALSPVLNAFTEHASKKEFSYVLIAFFLVEFIFGFLLDTGHFAYGFSPLFFIGLYLLARYIRLYPDRFFSFSKWGDLAVYIGVSVISILGLWFGYKWFGMGFHLNHYDSPFAIVASLYFLLFFSKLKFQNRTVNWLASSAFAIYLIHENTLVSRWYHHLFGFIQNNYSLATYYLLIACIVIVLALVFILIDKLRILVWNWASKLSLVNTR